MKLSEICLLAAEGLDKNYNFSCNQLASKMHRAGRTANECEILIKLYTNLFSPRQYAKPDHAWLADAKFETAREEQAWRVMAVLFLAEILKDTEKTLGE